jgi:hypothetical protein
MNKRSLYSIPFASFALMSIGCPEAPPEVDPIIGTFDANIIYGVNVPSVLAARDINGDGTLICDVVADVDDFIIDANLTGDLTSTNSYENCQLNGAPDPASDGVQESYTYTTATTIVTANTKYTIVLTGVAKTNTLDCDLAGTALTCTDDNDAAWAFTAK